MFYSILNILFPKLCIACQNHLFEQEKHLCIYCELKINWVPFTNGNLPYLSHRFYGKFPFQHLNSLAFYDHDGVSKQLLHHLKYKSKTDIGVWFADQTFEHFKNHKMFHEVDAILKIPIHSRKLKERGYNQLDAFADRLSELFRKPIINDAVIRNHYTKSQTQKGISDRNYATSIFSLVNENSLKSKHILIIDDVITTGSTIEQMANLLLTVSEVKISVFAMATAK